MLYMLASTAAWTVDSCVPRWISGHLSRFVAWVCKLYVLLQLFWTLPSVTCCIMHVEVMSMHDINSDVNDLFCNGVVFCRHCCQFFHVFVAAFSMLLAQCIFFCHLIVNWERFQWGCEHHKYEEDIKDKVNIFCVYPCQEFGKNHD